MSFQVEEDNSEFRVFYKNAVMHFPKRLYYSEQDAWLRVGEYSLVATVGLTDYVRIILGENIAVEFKMDLDTVVTPQDEVGSIKSNKTKFKLFPPVSGKIIAINGVIKDQPSLIKSDNYEKGWLFKIDPNDLDADLRDLCINAKYYVKVLKERVEE